MCSGAGSVPAVPAERLDHDVENEILLDDAPDPVGTNADSVEGDILAAVGLAVVPRPVDARMHDGDEGLVDGAGSRFRSGSRPTSAAARSIAAGPVSSNAAPPVAGIPAAARDGPSE